MKFEDWLLTKRHENNAIGDLARDYNDACISGDQRSSPGEPLDESHLNKWNATSAAYSTLRQAKRLYKKELK